MVSNELDVMRVIYFLTCIGIVIDGNCVYTQVYIPCKNFHT